MGSAVRLSTDVTGETEEESLLEAAALETHQISASNLREGLLASARNRIVVERLLQNLVGNLIGSDTTNAFTETQTEEIATGAIVAVKSGLLVELDDTMFSNTVPQTVRQLDVTLETPVFGSTAGTDNGTLQISELQPVSGTLFLKCTRGFSVEISDPEQFNVAFQIPEFKRTIRSSFNARPFRSFDWPGGGFNFTINRKTESLDPFNQMTNPVIKNATPSRIRLERLQVTFSPLSFSFTIVDPATASVLFSIFLPTLDAFDGPHDLTFFNGLNFSFDWQRNPSLAGEPDIFDVLIHPYQVGDIFTVDVDSESGRLQKELRRQFDFAFTQKSTSPTISESVVPPDLSFIKPFLGA